MGRRFASGRNAMGECARSGRKMRLASMVEDGYYPGLLVDPQWRETRHPLERLPEVSDPVALRKPAPENSKDYLTTTVRFPLYDLANDETVSTLKVTDDGTHDFQVDTFKVALYDSVVELDTYSSTDEVSSTNYTAGGANLTLTTETEDGATLVSASDSEWSNVSFTAACAVIYNASAANAVVGILSFGNPRRVTGTFTIQWPEPLVRSA